MLIQFFSPDDEHNMLETCTELYINKYIEKNLCVKLDNCQESVYSKLKGEAIDRRLWGIRFGIGYRPVVRQTTELMTNL